MGLTTTHEIAPVDVRADRSRRGRREEHFQVSTRQSKHHLHNTRLPAQEASLYFESLSRHCEARLRLARPRRFAPDRALRRSNLVSAAEEIASPLRGSQ